MRSAASAVFPRPGFLHSETAGSKDLGSLPASIAALRVLLRLKLPRHPPLALKKLRCPTEHRIDVCCCPACLSADEAGWAYILSNDSPTMKMFYLQFLIFNC